MAWVPIHEQMGALKSFVKDLASTNWTIFTGTIAGGLTCLVYLTGVLVDKHPQLDTFVAWLAFVSSWIGFGVRQFRHKRETFNDPTRSERGRPSGSRESPDVRTPS